MACRTLSCMRRISLTLEIPKSLRCFLLQYNFLRDEIMRAEALGAMQITLHPGAHVGAGEKAGLDQIIKD